MIQKRNTKGGLNLSIRKLLQEGDGSKKVTARSFRLRSNAFKFLEEMANKTGISVNETLNIILEEAHKDFELLQNIEEYLSCYIGNIVECHKFLSNGMSVRMDIKNGNPYVCNMVIILQQDNNFEEIYDETFKLKDISELLDYGLNSAFQVSYTALNYKK